MADSATLKEAIAYLREEIPTQDISAKPVVAHPHNTVRTVPERLPAARIKELSQLRPAIAVLWTFGAHFPMYCFFARLGALQFSAHEKSFVLLP